MVKKVGDLLASSLVLIGIFLFLIALEQDNLLIKLIGIVGSIMLIIIEGSVFMGFMKKRSG